jgi:hypothetical protein
MPTNSWTFSKFLKPLWILLQQFEEQTVLNLVEADTALAYSDLALSCVFWRIRACLDTFLLPIQSYRIKRRSL